MKKFYILFWVLLVNCVISNLVKCKTIPLLQRKTEFIEKTFYFDNLSFRKPNTVKDKDYDIVEIKGTGAITKIGEPLLPIKFYQILLPPDATLNEVEIVSKEEHVVSGNYIIYPAQPPKPISSQKTSEFVLPKKEIYESNKPYPAEIVGNYHTGTLSGFRIGSFSVAPIKYIPTKGELKQITKLKIRIYYKRNKVSNKAVWGRHKELIKSQVKRLIINPEDISRWSPPNKMGTGTTSKSLQEDTIDYVIVAPELDTIYFQPLAYWKTKKGVPAKMVAKEWIDVNYTGDNLREKIKNFIRDANTTWGAIWFLLGGDGADESGWMPERGCYGYVASIPYPYIDKQIPSERYWEDLDNNWNYDGDALYGEKDDGMSGADIDMYEDIWIGRASVNTASKAQTVVNNILTYEKSPATNYIENILLCSAHIFSNHYGYYTTDSVAKLTPALYVDDKNDYEQGRNTYPGDQAMISKMNAGCGFFCASSHGEYDRIMDGTNTNNDITNNNIDTYLNVGNKLGIYTGICCLSGKIDVDCYAEHLCNHPDGGAVVVIHNSRYGWAYPNPPPLGPSNNLTMWFFDEIFQKGNYKHIGHALAIARDRMIPWAVNVYNEHRWSLFGYNLFGCPEMPIRTRDVDTLQVMHDTTIINTVGNFLLTVMDNDGTTLVDSALVCLWCNEEQEMYARGWTNSLGEITLPVNPTIAGDTMWVTVTAHNYLAYEDYAIVTTNGVSYEVETTRYGLQQNYPNPITNKTTIKYQIPVKSKVVLKIYDLSGRVVRTLIDAIDDPGYKEIIWNGIDKKGGKVLSGVYFCCLQVCKINKDSKGEAKEIFYNKIRKLTIIH